MEWIKRYETTRARLLRDSQLCEANRNLFAQFFQYEEHKLKRQQGLTELDEACGKTLYGYVYKFKLVNGWFGNKPWADLTKEDIKRVYEALEDGRIRNSHGVPFADRQNIYAKVFKSKPFQMAGKADLAREVIEFSVPVRREVRFATEDSVKAIASVLSKPSQLLLLWLAWDIGENVDALLKLSKMDFVPQVNRYTGEREYLVNLPQSKIKRSRQSRSEPTLYPETVRYADMVLASLDPDEVLFKFEYAQARKFMRGAVRRAGALTEPSRQPVRWKDLRSGMACHLLKAGWSRDEVNARLGHTPHSDAIDAYINYLAIDRQQSKQKLHAGRVESLQLELARAQQTARLSGERALHQETENQALKADLADIRAMLKELRTRV